MPTGTQLVTNPKEILQLAKDLLLDLKRIEELNGQLAQDLSTVAKSWQDDSFVTVYDMVVKINQAVEQRQDDIGMVAQQLCLYAEALLATM